MAAGKPVERVMRVDEDRVVGRVDRGGRWGESRGVEGRDGMEREGKQDGEKKVKKEKKEKKGRKEKKEKKEKREQREKKGKKEKREKEKVVEDRCVREYGVSPLSIDDFFRRATEFRVWLKYEKGKAVLDLPTKEAHRYFEEFCVAWNAASLPKQYYTGISALVTEAAPRTAHTWGFTSKLTTEDKSKLDAVKGTAEAATETGMEVAFRKH